MNFSNTTLFIEIIILSVSNPEIDNSRNFRHSEAHSQSAEWLQKTRRSAGLFCNYLARLTRMRILQAKESS